MLAHKLLGTVLQMAVCQLDVEQSVYCPAGSLRWKTPNVTAESRLTGPASRPAGYPPSALDYLSKALEVGKRILGGESLVLQYYTAVGSSGLVTFAGALPGEMRAVELDGSSGWYVERNAFVAAETTVRCDIAVTEPHDVSGCSGRTALRRVTGHGTLLIADAGSLVELNPARHGGIVACDPGCVVAFGEQIRYRDEGDGTPNASDSGTASVGNQGVALVTVEGDGTVILQSTTLQGLERALAFQARSGAERKRPLGGFLSGTFD